MAGEVHDDKQQDQNDRDDPRHLYPAWRVAGRFAVGPYDVVVAWIRGRVIHMRILGGAWSLSAQAFPDDLPFFPFLGFLPFIPFIPVVPFITRPPNRSPTQLSGSVPEMATSMS